MNKPTQPPQGADEPSPSFADAGKAGVHRPALMENSYHANRSAPLIPGAQPQRPAEGPVGALRSNAGSSPLPVGAGPVGAAHAAAQASQKDRRTDVRLLTKMNRGSTMRGSHLTGRKGFGDRRFAKVTSAPAAALRLLEEPKPGAPLGICIAPPSCRVLPSDAPGVLGRNSVLESKNSFLARFEQQQLILSGPPSERHDSEANFMIPTPTGSAAWDTMPSTPTGELQAGMAWPPSNPMEAARHAPSGQHLANVYSPYPQPEAMPVLRLSEVLPGQSVPLMGPGLCPLQDHAQMQPPMPPHSLPGYYGSHESTSASGGSACFEGGAPAVKPVLGSPDLPSKGSALHAWKACKPCAFVFLEQDGCQNGTECEFCHLCEPGERKRRKKERKIQKREAREDNQGAGQLAYRVHG